LDNDRPKISEKAPENLLSLSPDRKRATEPGLYEGSYQFEEVFGKDSLLSVKIQIVPNREVIYFKTLNNLEIPRIPEDFLEIREQGSANNF